MTDVKRVSRRELVQVALAGGAGVLAAHFAWSTARRWRGDGEQATQADALLTSEQLQTLSAAQERILPAGASSPGAKQVGATEYTHRALKNPSGSTDDLETLQSGLERLDQRAQQAAGKPFHLLLPSEQDDTLRAFQSEDDDGATWMGLVVVFTLEALLGDPIYGGNADEKGWAWLDITPGFPRPPKAWTERPA